MPVDSFGTSKIKHLFLNKNVEGSSGKYNFDKCKNIDEIREFDANILALQKLLPGKILSIMNQKHTNDVRIINNKNHEMIFDGQICTAEGIALIVQTADCIPVLLADYDKNIIAAVHAGWRGARAGIIQNAVLKMRELGATNIEAVIGPCIKQESYEVDIDFYDNFISETDQNKQYFIASNKKYLFDNTSYVKDKLADLEISNIFDININTYNDKDFYSFRRYTHHGGEYGSNISAIYIEP